MLRQLQKDFYEHIVPFGEFTGIEFIKYTSAQQQVKTYNERVDHRIDEVNKLAEQAQQEIPGLKLQLEQTQYMLATYELELEKKIELKKQQEAALKRQIEINERIAREKEQMEKDLKAKREAELRVAKIKKLNNVKGKDKDDDNERGFRMRM